MTLAAAAGLVPLAVWMYLLLGRGMFWRARDNDSLGAGTNEPASWPSVTAIVPARDEADVIARVLASLLAQDYPGAYRIVLIDDQSTDGTTATAEALDAGGRLHILRGTARAPGWTGKLWAVNQGIAHAASAPPDYFWLTDADIAHAPDNLRRLVARAEATGSVLVSLMAKLHCKSFAEKLLIPAFVFFFQMIFPFAWVNRRDHPAAAAAGGCMLVRRDALQRAGGIGAIRSQIIDDCALARALKAQGPIWLGLTERAVSLRPYGRLNDIRRMVARSAYAQLGYSPLLVLGVVAAMAWIYVEPPLALFFGPGVTGIEGGLAFLGMTIAFMPMVRFYRLAPAWAFLLPVIGALYALFTVDSAFQHWRGRGGLWKGRIQAQERA
jgi:hopene-associated glycosyltransferase HpnB